MTTITFEYEPREHFRALHERSQRWACMVVHRRGGKTVACINELLTRATYTSKKDARYAYIAPFYRQAKDVAWQYLKAFGDGGIIVKTRESELRVELFNGAWITLYGADNPDALRGLYLDGVVMDEYGDCRPSLWGTVVLPCLADRKGWAIFIGTPKGKNHFYEIAQRAKAEDGWYYLDLKASESGIIDDEELGEMKLQMSPEEYQQEMECDFAAAVKGTYYADTIQSMELDGRIGDKGVYDPSYPVNVSSDLGYTDSCCWWFWQDLPDGPSIIDYYENQGQALQIYFDMLRYKAYNYGTIWLPHDAKAKTLQTGKSTIEQFLEEDFPVDIVPKLSRQHGIDAARFVLPHCTINQDKCYDGVEALRAYRRQYNELTKSFSDSPVHDWASNGADGFRYLSLVCKQNLKGSLDVRAEALPLIKSPEYRLEDLFADRERPRHGYQRLRI